MIEEPIEKPVEQPVEEPIEEEGVVEFTTREDYITCSYFAISSVSDIDTGMMSKEDAKKIKRIIRKSIKIIHECVNEMYNELFDSDEEDS